MRKSILLLLLTISIAIPKAFSQINNYIDINRINAYVNPMGSLWQFPGTTLGAYRCEFPKSSGRSVGFSASLWMSGYDYSGNLHTACEMYRQSGNDYWAGAIDTARTTFSQYRSWNYVWKVKRSTIDTFRQMTSHDSASTPRAILTWPGCGNAYARGIIYNVFTQPGVEMAPFIDVNGNGKYEPLLGEYPDIRGDVALWWVYNDSVTTGTTRNTKGRNLKVEVHAMAYAYNRGTLIDNVVYYQYKIFNKSADTYTNFRIGQFADFDLGWGGNDYIGFDSARRLGIVYNKGIDTGGTDTNAIKTYGTSVPVAGMTVIKAPTDNFTSVTPLANFMYFNNDTTKFGNPTTDVDYDNLLRGNWKDGSQLAVTYGSSAWCPSYTDAGTPIKYAYPDDPTNATGWSQCNCNDADADKRFLLVDGNTTFRPGEMREFVVALVTADPDPANICPGVNFNNIKQVTDTAWAWYYHPPVAVNEPFIAAAPAIQLFPNPVTDVLNLALDGNTALALSDVTIINNLGQRMPVTGSSSNGHMTLGVSNYTPGVYLVRYQHNGVVFTGRFVKE